MCPAVLTGWLEAEWAWAGISQCSQTWVRGLLVGYQPSWSCTGWVAGVKGLQSRELQDWQKAGALFAEQQGKRDMVQGSPGAVLMEWAVVEGCTLGFSWLGSGQVLYLWSGWGWKGLVWGTSGWVLGLLAG